jgi:hypothetical protein
MCSITNTAHAAKAALRSALKRNRFGMAVLKTQAKKSNALTKMLT